jgi:hypothetical protein
MIAIRLSELVYVVPIGRLALGGWTCLTRTSFMPHHSAAVGRAWADLAPNMQLLMLRFMQVIGALHLALAAGLASVARFVFPRRPRAVAGFVSAIVGGFYVAAIFVVRRLDELTDASPPMTGLYLSFGAIAVALILAWLTRPVADRPPASFGAGSRS